MIPNYVSGEAKAFPRHVIVSPVKHIHDMIAYIQKVEAMNKLQGENLTSKGSTIETLKKANRKVEDNATKLAAEVAVLKAEIAGMNSTVIQGPNAKQN